MAWAFFANCATSGENLTCRNEIAEKEKNEANSPNSILYAQDEFGELVIRSFPEYISEVDVESFAEVGREPAGREAAVGEVEDVVTVSVGDGVQVARHSIGCCGARDVLQEERRTLNFPGGIMQWR